MEANQTSHRGELSNPEKAGEADSGQHLFTKFSMKTLFGFTAKLESGASKDQAVLKSFQIINGDLSSHTGSQEERHIISGEGTSDTAHLLPAMPQPETTSSVPSSLKANSTFGLDVDSTGLAVSGVGDCTPNGPEAVDAALGSPKTDAEISVDSRITNDDNIWDVDTTHVSDHHEADVNGLACLEQEQMQQNEPSISNSGFLCSPLSEASREDDKESILVQGTLVDTTSDTESDNETTGPTNDENVTNKSVCWENDDKNKEKQVTDGDRETDGTINGDKNEQTASNSIVPSTDGDATPQEICSDTRNLIVNNESMVGSPTTGEDMQEPGEEPDSLTSNSSTESLQKPASSEKTFQLPAFFSGLRVRKKGSFADVEETVTEIKQKDSELAVLKLRQPVKKAHIAPELITKRKPAEPKAAPTFLEQLSQFLGPKTEDKDSCEVIIDAGSSEDSQGRKSPVRMEPISTSEEIKPSPAESALDAFRALFTRPPKRETTADPSELEAIKRKMRHEKESLKAVFERSVSKSGDGAADTKPVR